MKELYYESVRLYRAVKNEEKKNQEKIQTCTFFIALEYKCDIIGASVQ